MEENAPPAEAQLIKVRREARRPKLSQKRAAEMIGLSDSRWRQIESGYETARAGVRTRVDAPALTLAQMASVVGVTPKELREAGRPDAATELENLSKQFNSGPLPDRDALSPYERHLRSQPARKPDDEFTPDAEERIIEDNWNAVVDLVAEVLKSSPTPALRQRVQRIVFLMSGHLIIRILTGPYPTSLEHWLQRIYVERESLYTNLADGDPARPWSTEHSGDRRQEGPLSRGKFDPQQRVVVWLGDDDGNDSLRIMTWADYDQMKADGVEDIGVVVAIGAELTDEAALAVGWSLLQGGHPEEQTASVPRIDVAHGDLPLGLSLDIERDDRPPVEMPAAARTTPPGYRKGGGEQGEDGQSRERQPDGGGATR